MRTAAMTCVVGILLLVDGYLGDGWPLGLVQLAADVALLGLTWRVVIECRRGLSLAAFGFACLAPVGSYALSKVLKAFPASDVPGVLELLMLLVLWAVACRHLPYWQLPLLGILDLAALDAMLYHRDSWLLKVGTGAVLLLLPLGLLIGAFALYLRFEAGRRTLAAESARQSERLELARDLHDHVTHYVTAIVVQAQAGQEAVERDPATGRKLFTNIEQIGQDGLVAMGRMVRLLRDREHAPVLPAAPTIDALRDTVNEFALPGCSAHCELPDEIEAASWSPEVIKSVERLVQEGLTNVRKHARSATQVHVIVRTEGDRVTVRVRDNGARGSLPRFRPSGLGMIGLS
jgi:signal transduction histidine kinase